MPYSGGTNFKKIGTQISGGLSIQHTLTAHIVCRAFFSQKNLLGDVGLIHSPSRVFETGKRLTMEKRVLF